MIEIRKDYTSTIIAGRIDKSQQVHRTHGNKVYNHHDYAEKAISSGHPYSIYMNATIM